MKSLWNFITDERHSRGIGIVVPLIIAIVAGLWAILSPTPTPIDPIPTTIKPKLLEPKSHRFGDHLFGYAKLVVIDGKQYINLEFSNGTRRDVVLRAEVVCVDESGDVLSRENVSVGIGNSGGLASAYEKTQDVYLPCDHPNAYKVNWDK
ncbi:hypothetical protein THOG05_780002 [Vibrio rotiferianus]|uniref:hypothetical protein n=1 Tax=Vibrio rotiferianus TaxID=190895 RepID=UPI0028939B43|nr:hypothetical protein THOG05_780002 [Vibrio rotiferianus]